MENTENNRENSKKSLIPETTDHKNQVTVQQKDRLRDYVSNNSGILEGRFFGPLQRKQADLWKKIKDELNQNGAILSVPEWKKVWWNLKKEMGEKPSPKDSKPSDSGPAEDDDVMVVLEERKMKKEDINEDSQNKSDGRKQQNNPTGLGDDAAKRKRDSLSPVSSISSSFNSRSISPPRIGDMRSNKSYSERPKSTSRSKRSPPYSRDSSHYRKRNSYHSRYVKSRSPSNSKSTKHPRPRLRSKSPSESRESSRKRYRSKSPVHSHKGKYSSEREAWETFRTEVDALEAQRWADEQIYKKNPEKHPDYKVEWKKFYKSRAKELINRGKDPKSFNFESEWVYFWKWKMDELLRADFETKKDAIRRKLQLPEDESKSPYKPKPSRLRDAGDDAQTSTSIHSSLDKTNQHSSEANMKTAGNNPGLISTLRIVTAVEEQLGSLGPQVNSLLSQSVALQRISGSSPDSLLSNQDNFILLEIVREKLMGQIQSKIVRKALVGAVMDAIDSIDKLLKIVPSPDPLHCQSYVNTMLPQGLNTALPSTEVVADVNIPGVGSVDRIAIAQQIAEVLVKQGKTDVTEAELQELVNEVLGMAKTQASQDKVESFLGENIQSSLTHSSLTHPLKALNFKEIAMPETASSLPDIRSTSDTASSGKENSALDLLMSVVQSGVKKSNSDVMSLSFDSDKSETECSEDKIALNRFTGFKLASREWKKNLSADNAAKKSRADLKINSQEIRRPISESFYSSHRQNLPIQDQNKAENDRVNVGRRRDLSPFSSRKESSNPLSTLEVENNDLKIIGAWDSDSDIDLDSTEITKAPAYEKGSTRIASPDGNESSSKPPNKELIKDRKVPSSPKIFSTLNLNINTAIDDLMGSLKRKSSGKLSSGEHISVVDPSNNKLGQVMDGSFSTGQHSGIANPNYAASYCQQGMHGQPPFYGGTSVPGYVNQMGHPYPPYTYGVQNTPNYNYMTGASGNQYNPATYAYCQGVNQSAAQAYYSGGGNGQVNSAYQGYNYQPNFSANTGTAHSTNYQAPYH